MDLYSIGEMVIDFTPGMETASYIRNPGGAPANMAIAMAKNGLDASMLCSLGNDDFGRFLAEVLEENGVRSLKPELCEQAVTTMAFVSLDADGDRSFTFARKPGADMFIEEADVRMEDIEDTIIVHAGSCSLSAEPAASATRRALRLGREAGKLVSFDVNYRNLMWNDDADACLKSVREILTYVDIMKISEEEAAMLGGQESIVALMEEYDIGAVVETLGAHGARCFFAGRILECPSTETECVDATGAGDAFWGGFLSSLRFDGVEKREDLNDDVLLRAGAWGNAAGRICVGKKGAIPALPTREMIAAVLEEVR